MTERATIDISGLDKADVFAALYNRAKAQGLGFLHFDPTPMSTEQARAVLEGEGWTAGGDYPGGESLSSHPNLYFDYFKGRVMKVDLTGDVLSTWLYDRDNGAGSALSVLRPLIERRDALIAA